MEKQKIRIRKAVALADNLQHIAITRRDVGDTTLLIEGIKATKAYHIANGTKFIILTRTHQQGGNLAQQAGLKRDQYVTVVPEEPFKPGLQGVYVFDPEALEAMANTILLGLMTGE